MSVLGPVHEYDEQLVKRQIKRFPNISRCLGPSLLSGRANITLIYQRLSDNYNSTGRMHPSDEAYLKDLDNILFRLQRTAGFDTLVNKLEKPSTQTAVFEARVAVWSQHHWETSFLAEREYRAPDLEARTIEGNLYIEATLALEDDLEPFLDLRKTPSTVSLSIHIEGCPDRGIVSAAADQISRILKKQTLRPGELRTLDLGQGMFEVRLLGHTSQAEFTAVTYSQVKPTDSQERKVLDQKLAKKLEDKLFDKDGQFDKLNPGLICLGLHD